MCTTAAVVTNAERVGLSRFSVARGCRKSTVVYVLRSLWRRGSTLAPDGQSVESTLVTNRSSLSGATVSQNCEIGGFDYLACVSTAVGEIYN